KKWKQIALSSNDRKAMARAFFWSELQAAFIMLFSIEQIRGKDPEMKKRLIIAKANLSKRLADYSEAILNELRLVK
ncbi:MAG: hypothetical protein HYS98_08640, partial [Deltaproteobacteria bacterium]|nr:hypothetical protein [Deltaproteobacteria bacterium]